MNGKIIIQFSIHAQLFTFFPNKKMKPCIVYIQIIIAWDPGMWQESHRFESPWDQCNSWFCLHFQPSLSRRFYDHWFEVWDLLLPWNWCIFVHIWDILKCTVVPYVLHQWTIPRDYSSMRYLCGFKYLVLKLHDSCRNFFPYGGYTHAMPTIQ